MDSKNSIATRDILRNFTFTGVMTLCENTPEININITCNEVSTLNTIQVFINYSNDLINIKQEFHPIDVIDNVTQYNIRSRPLARYFSVSLINGLNNIIKFNMETSLKTAVGYTDQDGVSVNVDNFPTSFFIYNTGFEVTNDVLVNGHVVIDSMPPVEISNYPLYTNIDNFPISQAVTGTFYQPTQPVSIALPVDTNIKTIDSGLTFLCQERPTTQSYFTTAVSVNYLSISLSSITLRNFCINTTSATIIYVYLYDNGGVLPDPGEQPSFVFTIMNSNNIIFNSFDHKFSRGILIKASTTYGGNISPAANTVFVNMTLSS